MNESRLATVEDLEPHGMGCSYCPRVFEIGDEYVSVLTGMIGDTPCCEVVCPECAPKLDTLIDCAYCSSSGVLLGEQCPVCKGAGQVFDERPADSRTEDGS